MRCGFSCGFIKTYVPSGKPLVKGRPSTPPTSRTPGTARNRENSSLRNATRWTFCVSFPAEGIARSMVRTCSVRKPGLTSSTRNRLRPNSPAPASRTTVIAICAAIMTRLRRCPRSVPVWPWPRSTSAPCSSPEVARSAVKIPSPAATATERANVKDRTGRFTATSWRRGRLLGASATRASTPQSAAMHAERTAGDETAEGLR